MRTIIWGIRVLLLLAVESSLIFSAIIVTSTVTLNGQGTIGVQGNPPVEFRSFQALPWFEVAGERGLAGVLAFITLIAFSAWAGWTGHTAVLATGSLLTLAFTYVTGFSIGRGYFPASSYSSSPSPPPPSTAPSAASLLDLFTVQYPPTTTHYPLP